MRMVKRLPLAGLTLGTYWPGVAFGTLSPLYEVSGLRPAPATRLI